MRLICAITGDVVAVPSGWTAWRIGTLHFRRTAQLIEWRESGSFKWRPLPAIERRRERIERPRRSS